MILIILLLIITMVIIIVKQICRIMFCFLSLCSCLDHVNELLTILSDNPNITAGENIPEDAENLEVTLTNSLYLCWIAPSVLNCFS